MSALPPPGPASLPIDFYTRYGELNLEGRLLLLSAQQMVAGDHAAALQDLLTLLPSAPWLQDFCAGRMQQLLEWRYGQHSQAERVLPDRKQGAAATAESANAADLDAAALLVRVLSQPSAQVVLHGCAPELLLEGLLQQAVWDAEVWVDPQVVLVDTLPTAASWLDGLATDRCVAPLRELRLREAERHLRQQHQLAWVPRRRPLPMRDAAELEGYQPADWPRCLHRSMGRRWEQAQLMQGLEGALLTAEHNDPQPHLSVVLTINGSDAAEVIRCSLACLADAMQAERNLGTELLVVHPPLKPAQRSALETAMASPALSDLQLLEIPRGSGLALACNRALVASRGSQLLLLRAGVSLGRGVLAALLQAMEDPSCRAVQPALVSSDGRMVGLGYGFAQAGHAGQSLLHGQAVVAQWPAFTSVQAVLGSCCLWRRQELLAVGGWDGQFQNGLEDQDLCLRLIRHFGGYCRVRCSVRSTAPLGHGVEATHRDRDWNRQVFLERWQDRVSADLAELAGPFGYYLIGLLPELNPPSSSALSGWIGVLAPRPVPSEGLVS